MKSMALALMLFFSSCAVFKEKQRLKTDSLFQEKLKEQINLSQQWRNSEYEFKDGNSLQLVLIKADAPFKWQADSGLTAKSGNFQLYLVQQGKSVTAKQQSVLYDMSIKKHREEKEIQKSVKAIEQRSSVVTKAGLISCSILLLLIGLVVGRRLLLKWI